jgi:hypothetical protein
MPTHSAALDAWVVGGRHRHHRERDHFGADSDLYTVLANPIGPWPVGTPVTYVLADIYQRQTSLSSANRIIRVLHVDGLVLAAGPSSAPVVPGSGRGITFLNATVKAHRSASFTVDALQMPGGRFTVDAWVRGYAAFIVNAWTI